ncbi:putative cation-transporting ATPase 13A4 isoform 2-T2 [Discoglossus pictus]
MTQKYALLNQGEDVEMELHGYRSVRWRQVLCYFGYIFSLGFLRILFYWKPEWDVWCQSVPCCLEEANVVLLRTTDELKQYYKKNVIIISLKVPGSEPGHQIINDKNSLISKSIIHPDCKVRYIIVKKIRYVWNTFESKFQKIGMLDEELSCSEIHSKFGSGLSREEQEFRQQVCGLNTIEVKIIPIWQLLVKQILNPFYVFQAYSLTIWLTLAYFEYSLAVLIMTVMSISATIYNMRVQSVKLHKMADSYNSVMVTVLHKNGDLEEVESQSLVPGDVIILQGNKLFLPCDAILIRGGCSVNESMLTGESVPVTKTALPHINNAVPWRKQSGEDYKRHVLFCGTEVIQTKAYGQDLVKAVVLQTGFNTAKGDLVRAILYNKPMNIRLHREAMRFLFGLVGVSVFAFIFTAVVFTMHGASVSDIVLMSFLALTICVNAALPGALTLTLLYAQTRLKKQGIFCISPQTINVSGQLNLICLDKTGTLTEDVLDLWGILYCEGTCFQDVHLFSSGKTIPWGPQLRAMASCHSLIILDGKLHGDPLELKMFEGTGWELENYITSTKEDGKSVSCTVVKPRARAEKLPVEGINILHQFPFSSCLQRMSVLTQIVGESDLTMYLKGAPETVIGLCKPETVPHSFLRTLDYYTMQGYRVIGLAYRLLDKASVPDMEQLDRDELESDLIFLGLLIMENRLKPETNAVLQELSSANIRTVMVTGDNLQTAVTVGKNSGMIPNGSKLIQIEATDREGDSPPSVTFTTMDENEKNRHSLNDFYLQIDVKTSLNHRTQGEYHFALSGKSYQIIGQYFYKLLPKILLNGTIFARMTPQQKSNLIEEFQKLDYYVGMCGDGANDCGALKRAQAGISLSELEASVASPFTSKVRNIECVSKLIKEGQNSLVTSFCVFKFQTTFTLVGFICTMFLYWKNTILSNYQYLMQDLAITIVASLTMSLTGPAPKLAPYRPPGRLLSPSLLLSVVLHTMLSFILHTVAFIMLQQQPWYNETDVFSACLPLNYSKENYTLRNATYSENYYTTTLSPISGMNLIVLEFIFAKGRPFRQQLYNNYLLCAALILQLAAYIFVLFADIKSVYTDIELVCTPYYWRINILIMILVLFIASIAVEEGFIENRRLWLWIKKTFNYKSRSQYRRLQKTIEQDQEWPPCNRTDYAIQAVCNGQQNGHNANNQQPTQNRYFALHDNIQV